MNKKLVYSLLLLFLGASLSFAQKSKVFNSGTKVVRVPLAYVHDAISVNSNDFLVVSYQVRGIYKRMSAMYDETSIVLKNNSRFNIYKFDDQLELIQKTSLERNIYGKRVWFEKLLKLGDNIWLFFSYSNVDAGKNYLFAQKFDPHNLEMEGDPIKVAEMPYKKKRYNYGYYNFTFSPDGNFLMIAGVPAYTPSKRLFRFKKEETANDPTLTAWVLNDKLEIVNYAKKVKLSSSGATKLSIFDYIVGNDGSITFLGSENKTEKTKRVRSKKKGEITIENKKFVVAHIDSTGDVKEYNFNSKDVRILDLKMAFNSVTGNLCAVGLYSELLKGAKGVISLELSSEDLSEISFNKSQFSDEFIKSANTRKTLLKKGRKTKETEEKPKSKYLSKKDKDNSDDSKDKKEGNYNSKEEIANLSKVVSVNFDNTGNPIGVFEKQWLDIVTTTTRNSNGSTTTTTTYYYYYDDAVICKVENGDISASQVIKKQTVLVNYSRPKGLDCLENDDKLLVLYGDKTVEFDKEDLKSNTKNGSTKRETNYKMLGFRKQLASNKILVFKPKGRHRLELQYYRY